MKTTTVYTEQIAKITHTFLGYEDHGMFSASLTFDYGGTGQGTGHYGLAGEGGIAFLRGILDSCGVSKWEDLKGRTVIVFRDEGFHGMVRGLTPLPTEPGTEFIFSDAWGDAWMGDKE